MAQPTTAFSTYDAKGNREDLVDYIYDVSPTDAPLMQAIPRVKAMGVLHEWQVDALDSAGTNYKIEGDDAPAATHTATTRRGNRCQILSKTSIVTGTQMAVKHAGRDDERAYQLDKMIKSLKRDIEFAISDNNAAVTGNDTLAREMAGFPAWIFTNYSKHSGGTLPTGDGSDAYSDGTARVFTEDLLQAALELAYTNGGNPSLGIVNAFNKRKVSLFAGNATRFDKSEDKKLVAAIDVYVGDFHTIDFKPSRFIETDMCYLVDPEYAALAWLRPLEVSELAISGDYSKDLVLAECTLEVRNEQAHAMVFDLTVS